MSNNNEPQDFFGEVREPKPDKIYVEVPSEQRPPYIERINNPNDPMGEVYLRGRMMRNMSSGGMPWWVLFSGFFLFGGLTALTLSAAIASHSFEALIIVVFAAIPLFIVCKGIDNKLSMRRNRRK
jgi:hypothetical protein